MGTTNRSFAFIFCALAAVLFCWVAFFNGFPLVYSDTGTYLKSGFELDTPLDRPITYGFLLRLFTLNGLTIWTAIIAQSAIVSSLLWLLLREFIEEVRKLQITFTTLVILLAFASGLPVVSGELIADIFTSAALFAWLLLVFGKKCSRTENILLYLIFLISVACHISHVAVIISLAALLSATAFVRSKRGKNILLSWRANGMTTLLCIVAFVVMMSSVSKSRHVFMMGHLVETGILNAYLDDKCGSEEISLCKYRDRLPDGAEKFIWNLDGDSVLILTGGWTGTKEEYSKIISETFTTGRYLKMHIAAAAKGTAKQLYSINCGEGLGEYDSTTNVSQQIREFFPREYDAYLHSRQSRNEFSGLPVIDLLNRIATILALCIVVVWLVFQKVRNEKNHPAGNYSIAFSCVHFKLRSVFHARTGCTSFQRAHFLDDCCTGSNRNC